MKKQAPLIKRITNLIMGELFGRWVVCVSWEHKPFNYIRKTHYGFSLKDAKEWANCYPDDAKIEIVYFPVFAQPRTINA